MARRLALILGSSGQLARALRSCESGFEATALGRPVLDLTDPRSVRDAIAKTAPALVINAAAYTAVDKAEEEPDAAFAVNETGAAAAADAAEKAGAAFVHVSTDYVFDGQLGRPYTEEDAPHPAGVYGKSKYAGETAVAAAHPEAVIVRTSGVFDDEGRNFVRAVAGRLIEAGEAKVVADQTLNPTFAPDLAAAIFKLAEARLEGAAEPGLYHAAGAGDASWFEVGEAIADEVRRLGHEASVSPTTTEAWGAPAPRPADSRLDCSKLREAAGVALPAWRAAIARCVASVKPV